ncbi:rc3h1 [Acrasis kona]|uniref:Rc3h1 n=1 Tax=Acrasis kona TaxID=1008807 RepID=A0AAW2YHG0_9EUKA
MSNQDAYTTYNQSASPTQIVPQQYNPYENQPQQYNPNPYPTQPTQLYPTANPVVHSDPVESETPYVAYNQNPYVTNTNIVYSRSNETQGQSNVAILLLILGFFIPIVWIICFFITRKQGDGPRRTGFVSLILFIIWVVMAVGGTILSIIISAASKSNK